MRRPLIGHWVASLALASVVTAVGCQHSNARGIGLTRSRGTPVATAPAHGPYVATTPVPAAPIATAAPVIPTQPNMLPPVTPQATEAPKEIVKSEPAMPAAPATPPAVETAKGHPASNATTVEQASSKLEAARVVSKWSSTSPRLEPAPRRAFVDITAHSCFAHAQDYGWLSGQLQHLRTKECWRLRYASVDEDDPYGGSVTLVDSNGLLSSCQDGQYVRISGRLLNAADRSIAPEYKVDSLQVLDMK